MIKKFADKNFFIKAGYASRLKGDNFIDATTKELNFQPEVYKLAEFLAERSGCTHIIDAGAGSGLRLIPLAKKFKIIAVDRKNNMTELRQNLPGQEHIDFDLEKGLPAIDEEILSSSVVISANVIERLKKPDKYIASLAKLSKNAKYLLLSTPDRLKVGGVDDFGPPDSPADIHEWSLGELNKLAKLSGFGGRLCGYTINSNLHKQKSTSLIISGTDMPESSANRAQKLVNAQAIITLFNEADIIEQVVNHLILQGVAVHIIDNWSTDGSYEKAKKLAGANEHITIERFPKQKPKYYEWGELLKRVEEVAADGSYDWYIHHDADELRVSPWPDLSLSQAISFIDGLGYNAIDFTIVDFRPTEDGFDGKQQLTEFFRYCEFGRRPGHFRQVKAWKQTGQKISLADSGGHEAVFDGRKIYPLKFLTKHYPLRSKAQAKRKVFIDRLPRLSPTEKKKGWHIQYNSFDVSDDFIWPKSKLTQFNQAEFYEQYLVERLSGIGLEPS